MSFGYALLAYYPYAIDKYIVPYEWRVGYWVRWWCPAFNRDLSELHRCVTHVLPSW
ncbi:MAG: hypothetical protein PHC63_04460 [Candidatus Bathyarchaeota archaeon]|nr:hypothetical protein [Candidatus Bathyarchaeota archaeon]